MNNIELKARAKINLTLDVLGKRPDGYHEVEMVMQSIELHDVVILREIEQGLEVVTDHPLLTSAASNIAYRAASLLLSRYGINRGVRIEIKKNIPVAAGLAGGSTDAATVLKGLNGLWGLDLSLAELADLAALIGSDVPFCIVGGTALAGGRGEVLTPLPDAPDMWLVLAKPPLEVSTAEVYRHFDPARVAQKPVTADMLRAVETGDGHSVMNSMANVLESVTLTRYPVVAQVKQEMEQCGVRRALMSGSGPTVFGIAESREDAGEIIKRLKARLPEMFIALSRTCPAGEQEFGGKA